MNLRLQTVGAPAVEVLKDGLHEMVEICNLLDHTLDTAVADYQARVAKGEVPATAEEPEGGPH